MRFVRVNGVVLHYHDCGRADQPVIVFSNSLGTDFRIWDSVIDHLSQDFRIIRYDKRGHGLSEATEPPYKMADLVADLGALLDHLKVGKATIVGLSVGGMIAQGLASRRPDLVSSLILCDTAHKIGNNALWNERIAAVSDGGIARIVDAIMERWFTTPYRSADNADYIGYVSMLTRISIDGYVGTCAAIRDCDLTGSTRALTVPALCIVGDQDVSTPPELVRSMAELIDGARFEIVEDAGHLPCIEQPGRTARLIEDFIIQCGASA